MGEGKGYDLGRAFVIQLRKLLVEFVRRGLPAGGIVKVALHDAAFDEVLQGGGELLRGLRRGLEGAVEVQVHLQGAVQGTAACRNAKLK